MEEGSKGSFGWRLVAVGSLMLLATGLGLMSFGVLPQIPPDRFGGVVRVALATSEGIRDNVIIVGAAFFVLGAATGLGYADKLVKPITWGALAVLAFFVLASWWTLRTIPVAAVIELR